MVKADDPREAHILAAFRGQGRGRSSVYQFLATRYKALMEAKAAGSRVDWISVTAELSALGFKARGNQPLNKGAVRRTWQRVEADFAADRLKSSATLARMAKAKVALDDLNRQPVAPFKAEPPPPDDFELHDVMGRPIVGPPDDDDDFRTLSGRPI